MSCCRVTMQSKTMYKKKEILLYNQTEPLSKSDAIPLEDFKILLCVHSCHLIAVSAIHFKPRL